MPLVTLCLACIFSLSGFSQTSSTLPTRPKLGVQVAGVVIEDVDPGSPAALAGMIAGDVLLSWERSTLSDVEQCRSLLAEVVVPSSIMVRILRGEETIERTLVFPASQEPPQLGVTPVWGVRIDRVIEDTVAASAALQRGDILLAMDDSAIESYDTLMEELRTVKSGERRTVRILRQDKTMEIPLTFGPPIAMSLKIEGQPTEETVITIPHQQLLMDSLRSLADLDEVQKEIDAVVGVLERSKTDAAGREALDRLRGVRGRLTQLSSVVRQAKDAATKVMTLAEEFDRVIERVAPEMLDWSEMQQVGVRAAQLISEGKNAAEVLKTLQREFHGLPIEAILRMFSLDGTSGDVKPEGESVPLRRRVFRNGDETKGRMIIIDETPSAPPAPAASRPGAIRRSATITTESRPVERR